VVEWFDLHKVAEGPLGPLDQRPTRGMQGLRIAICESDCAMDFDLASGRLKRREKEHIDLGWFRAFSCFDQSYHGEKGT
jgi:hypothetical protein